MGERYSAVARGSVARAVRIGSWYASDLPDAVPVGHDHVFSLVSEVGGLALMRPRRDRTRARRSRVRRSGAPTPAIRRTRTTRAGSSRGERQRLFASGLTPASDAIEQHLPVGVARLPSRGGDRGRCVHVTLRARRSGSWRQSETVATCSFDDTRRPAVLVEPGGRRASGYATVVGRFSRSELLRFLFRFRLLRTRENMVD